MGIYTLLVILIVIAAILMVGIVLIQESKGGGLASSFASYNQIGGVRKTTDFIEKTTWALAAFMVVVSIACAYVAPRGENESTLIDTIENPLTNPENTTGFGASEVQQQPAEAAPQQEEPAGAASEE